VRTAAIISTGTELITGEVIDSNGAYLSEQLTQLGIEVAAHLVVGDSNKQLLWSLTQASQLAEIVIITGGLGPTRDDLTRFALAEFAGVELVERPELIGAIEQFFHRRGRKMSPSNRIQAAIPAGATALENATGTAPGILMQVGRCQIFALPGVPREMKVMFVTHVKPRICKDQSPGTPLRTIRIQCSGAGESDITHQIDDLVRRFEHVRFGTRASEGIITLKLASSDSHLLTELEQQIRDRLGVIVFGQDDQTLAEVVGQMLRVRRQTLAVAESCTGGLVAKLITDVSGSSDYLLGGWISYSNDFKQAHLSVPKTVIQQFGAVSAECARAMLKGAVEVSGADWVIAITGIAGPGGGSDQKPVGLVYIAVGSRETCEIKDFHFGDVGREAVRLRAATTALNLLRLAIMKSNG